MTALAANRNTPRAEGDNRLGSLAATVVIYQGALVMRNSAGYLTKGAAATGGVGAGVALEAKTGGAAAGDETLRYRAGVFRFANSATTDAIAATDIGKVCYVVDDQTVAKTDGTASRSPAGFIEDVDDEGVWVRFDEALTQTYVAGVANPAA